MTTETTEPIQPDDTTTPPPAPEDVAAAASSAYDPSAYKVGEVLEYLEANPDQVDAVKAAEEAGKGRTTILDYEAPTPEEAAAASTPDPLVAEGTEEYDRQVVYPEDHPDAVPVAEPTDEPLV